MPCNAMQLCPSCGLRTWLCQGRIVATIRRLCLALDGPGLQGQIVSHSVLGPGNHYSRSPLAQVHALPGLHLRRALDDCFSTSLQRTRLTPRFMRPSVIGTVIVGPNSEAFAGVGKKATLGNQNSYKGRHSYALWLAESSGPSSVCIQLHVVVQGGRRTHPLAPTLHSRQRLWHNAVHGHIHILAHAVKVEEEVQ